MKKLFFGSDASLAGLVGLIFSTKICCVVGYWLAASIGLVGLGLSHWFLESFFKSLAISGLTFSIFQTTRNLIWCHKNWRKANWGIAGLNTAIVMVIVVLATPSLFLKSSSGHPTMVNDPICGPQGATLSR